MDIVEKTRAKICENEDKIRDYALRKMETEDYKRKKQLDQQISALNELNKILRGVVGPDKTLNKQDGQ